MQVTFGHRVLSSYLHLNSSELTQEATLNSCLSKKSFPVGWVGEKTASREVGIFFFFPNFNFFKLECTGGKVKNKKIFEKMKKKVPVGPFKSTRPVI